MIVPATGIRPGMVIEYRGTRRTVSSVSKPANTTGNDYLVTITWENEVRSHLAPEVEVEVLVGVEAVLLTPDEIKLVSDGLLVLSRYLGDRARDLEDEHPALADVDRQRTMQAQALRKSLDVLKPI